MAATDGGIAAILQELGRRLVNQESAEILVRPRVDDSGSWFDGGNIAVAPDGQACLMGRYRNSGDSRTGLELGERGAELVVFGLKSGHDPQVLHCEWARRPRWKQNRLDSSGWHDTQEDESERSVRSSERRAAWARLRLATRVRSGAPPEPIAEVYEGCAPRAARPGLRAPVDPLICDRCDPGRPVRARVSRP